MGTTPRARARLEWARLRALGDTTLALVDELVEPDTVAVDIGAAWGLYMARLAQLTGPMRARLDPPGRRR